MKTIRLFLFLFAMLLISGQCLAQDDLPYRHFQAFQKDTIRYLDYNFTLRSEQYFDKTVGELLHDLELPVVYINNLEMLLEQTENRFVSWCTAMNLVIRLIRDGNEDSDNSKDYYITIGFKTPIEDNEVLGKAIKSDKRNIGQNGLFYWTPQLYELLKDCKIQGIVANDRLFPDRRKLLETNMKGDFEKVKKIREAEKAKWRKIIREEKQTVDK